VNTVSLLHRFLGRFRAKPHPELTWLEIRILAVFMLRPGDSLTMRQLKTILDMPPHALYPPLIRLVNRGYLAEGWTDGTASRRMTWTGTMMHAPALKVFEYVIRKR
jgi:hypothetical protein